MMQKGRETLQASSRLVVHCHGYSELGLRRSHFGILRTVSRSDVERGELGRRRDEQETSKE